MVTVQTVTIPYSGIHSYAHNFAPLTHWHLHDEWNIGILEQERMSVIET